MSAEETPIHPMLRDDYIYQCWLEKIEKEVSNERGGARMTLDSVIKTAAVAMDIPPSIAVGSSDNEVPKRCMSFDAGWCAHKDGPENGCVGWGKCGLFEERRRLWKTR